jgi:hypothetical protein
MRRLLRILLNTATVLSLLLCVATAALWVRSYWTVDNAGYVTVRWPDPQRRDRHDVGLRTVKGKWLLWIVDNDFDFRFPHDISTQPPTIDEMRREDVTDRGLYWRSSPLPPAPSRADVVNANVAGFGWRQHRQRTRGRDDHERIVSIPAALPAACFAILPLSRLAAARRRRSRRATGLCPTCDYDLRGNESGVCPECGTAITVKA